MEPRLMATCLFMRPRSWNKPSGKLNIMLQTTPFMPPQPSFRQVGNKKDTGRVDAESIRPSPQANDYRPAENRYSPSDFSTFVCLLVHPCEEIMNRSYGLSSAKTCPYRKLHMLAIFWFHKVLNISSRQHGN